MPEFSRLLTEQLTHTQGGRIVSRLLAAFHYGEHRAPRGLETDGASVPRLLWPIANPYGQAFLAAVIHDALYQARTMDRHEADAVFLQAMADCGVPWWRRNAMWAAVRLFGGPYWRRCAACGASSGLRLVEAEYPQHPEAFGPGM